MMLMRSSTRSHSADQIAAASAAVNPDVEAMSDPEAGVELPKANTATVIGLLGLTSLTFSYLGAYAVSGALVRAEVLHRWRPDADPRPKWLILGFCVLLTAFVGIGTLARHLSRRELRQIDEMSDEAEEVDHSQAG
jgi:hypothetical protein